MKKSLYLWLLISFSRSFLLFSQKQITIEDIFIKNTFDQKTVYALNWMNDGRYYSTLEDNSIIQYEITTGDPIAVLITGDSFTPSINITGYTFSADEKSLLLTTKKEYIYRRSFLTEYYLYDIPSKSLKRLSSKGRQSNAAFSPQGNKVAFTRKNNLFYVDLTTMKEYPITTDGEVNKIINGSSDWVYEEEFYMVKAFWWAPDGEKIAYLTFNETDVKEYNMQVWGKKTLYPKNYRFKYPKAGEVNSTLQLSIYSIETKTDLPIDLGEEIDSYIPSVGWTKNPNIVYLKKLNRLQNQLNIFHVNAISGNVQNILTEKSDTYVDVNYCDDLTYLEDKKHFFENLRERWI